MVAGLGEAKRETRDRKAGGRTGGAGGTKAGGGGGAQYGETETTRSPHSTTPSKNAFDSKIAERRADAAAEAAKAAAGHTGTSGDASAPSTRPGAVPPGELPPGLSPLKYQNKPTQSFAPTASNLGQVAAQAVGTLTSPGLGLVPGAVKAITDDEYDPLNPFEKPEGMVGGSATPETSEHTAATDGLQESEFKPVKKAKKPAPPTLSSIGTLLSGVGGTLVAG